MIDPEVALEAVSLRLDCRARHAVPLQLQHEEKRFGNLDFSLAKHNKFSDLQSHPACDYAAGDRTGKSGLGAQDLNSKEACGELQ